MLQTGYKTCTKCLQKKPDSEFGWKDQTLGIRQSRRKACIAAASADWYTRNRERQIENSARNRNRSKEEAREYVWDYLSTHPCVDCGESNPIVLDFDHVRGDKFASVSEMIMRGYALDAIRQEIKKCEIRCANCHRKKSIVQFGWFSKKRN